MNESIETETPAEEETAPPLGELLMQNATPREQLAIRALEEGHLLTRDTVRAALVRETDGGLKCNWDLFSVRLYDMDLNDEERAFVHLVLSTVTSHQTSLARVIGMDERRLAIILRTIIRLSGNDTLAVGTRV